MKPKTKLQKRIYDLSKKLPPISEKQKCWAYKSLSAKYVVISRNRTFCLECGHKWDEKPLLAVKLDGCVCPACNQKLKFTEKTHVDYEKTYFALLTTIGGYQVVRMFLFTQRFKKKKATSFHIWEVMQHWIDESGQFKTLSVPANNMGGGYGAIDLWSYGDLEFRTETYSHKLRQEIGPYKVCPGGKVLSIIKRNGYKGYTYGFAPQWLFPKLLTDNRAETLYKTKQLDVLAKMESRARDIHYYWKSICICTRNNYIIKSATTWFDYLNLLLYFNKDIRNPKYICPDNLNNEHDLLMNKRRQIIEKREKEEEQRKFMQYQKKYDFEKGMFFHIELKDGDITVAPLKTIEEFKAEGESMHHCVFSNSYFKREDSLIMSAKVKGVAVETIEISLKDYSIVQSRGKCNKASDYHDEILNLVRNNMEQIVSIKQGELIEEVA